jgi:hypothetical protein
MSETMISIKKNIFQRNRVSCNDKAKGSIIESIMSRHDLNKIQKAFLPSPDEAAAERSQFLSAHLGHRFAFLLSYAATLRCESTRLLELSDLASIRFDDEGRNGADILVWSLGQGKTNQFGKIDRTAVMRHVDVEMCCQGATALALFDRFHIRKNPFPSFDRSINWYYLKLIQPATTGNKGKSRLPWVEQTMDYHQNDQGVDDGDDGEMSDEEGEVRDVEVPDVEAIRPVTMDNPNPSDLERSRITSQWQEDTMDQLRAMPGLQPISYETQRKAFRDALTKAGIQSTRVTHIGRAAATSIVGHFGKDLDTEMRRHGHWNKDAMSNCYTEGFREFRFLPCLAR